ncbi:hypothetical protein LWI29_019164 [Acer saccharum]|uniref:Cation/H+ exchanger domain-containing protein n=1 Tax=Acer saccharum TaxID=4024 RepID=A0AA39VTR8_ACESA|nr:hypothetical protein LWI29_019164 [Acer saccharum]
MLTSELGTIAMSCAILHEILGWFLLSLSVFLQEGDLRYTIESVVAMSVLMLFIILVLRPMVQCIIRRILEGKPVDGFYIKAILVGPLIMGFLSDMIGATILPGALIMGLIIPAGPPLGSSLVEKSELIISELILPFMYIRIGQLTNVYSITDWKAFTTVQFILLAGFLGKMAGCLSSLLCSNNGGVRNSFLLGLFLNTKGVIELSLTLRWRARKLIDEPVFATLVIYYIVVTAIVTPLLQIFNKPQGRLEATSSMKNTTRSLQATLLTSELRIMCCFHYEENVHGIITLLKSCSSTGISPMCVYVAHLIDLVGRAAPLLHPYNSQRKRFRENSTDRIMKALKTSLIKGSSSPVTIQPFRVIAPYDTIHESICRLARDKYIPLVLVPFLENLDTHGRKSALHSFNILMQAYAPCTVGILVDRSLPRIFSSIYFTYNIGVLFLGGPDDREALALVLRISDHPGVSITVLRIDLRGEKFENQSEKYLDDCLVSEFKARNIGNASVVCRKLVAENTMQVVDSIRSLENNYDLVIVGKQRGPSSQLERDMLPWVENEELGTIGDMVASSDFCGGTVSVLVMHCAVGGHVNVTGSSSMTNSDERSRFFSSSSSFDILDLSVKKAGIIMGPSVLGYEKKIMDKVFEPKNLLLSHSLSTMGAIYFVFITSVKMDKSRILLTPKKVWNVSMTCFFIPFIISITLLCLLKNYLSGINGNMTYLIYISIAKSISHYSAISHTLGELNLLNSELGNLALSTVMLHEILAGLFIATATLAIPGNKKKAIISQFYLVILIIFLVFVLRPLMKWIIRTTPAGKPVKEVYVQLILIIPLITGMLSDSLGATFYTGAQMMGLIIPAGPPLVSVLVEKSELIIMSEILLPFFYIQIGQYTYMQATKDWTAFWTIMFISIAVSLARMAGSLLSLLCFNAGLRNAVLLGIIMENKGVIELNVYLMWTTIFAAFVLSIIAINAVATPLIQIFYKRETSFSARSCSIAESHLRTLQLARPISEFRVICCIHVEDNVNGMITLLKASNPTEISSICAYTLHLTQLIGRSAPILAPYEIQRKKVQPNSTDRIMHALSKFLKTSSVLITIRPLRVIAPYKTMHETICKLARDEVIPLIIVPFPESLEFHGKITILRGLNINIQTYAPCTVGTLVDRSAQHHQSTTHFSYNVVVFFFGGPDDREALALALRMSGHPGVSITMIRIDYIPDTEGDDEIERHLDEAFINEFKSSNIGNACMVCHEVVVAEETMQVMNAIRFETTVTISLLLGNGEGLIRYWRKKCHRGLCTRSLV